jgi:hypothetical protein
LQLCHRPPTEELAKFFITHVGLSRISDRGSGRFTWWSTRLYLIASLAQWLTQARRILVVNTTPVAGSKLPVAPNPAPPPPVEERFVGQLSTNAILSTIGPKVPALDKFAKWLQARPIGFNQMNVEVHELLAGWHEAFDEQPHSHTNEENAKIDLTAEILRRWFGDAMLQQPMKIADLQHAYVVDLLRLLDYQTIMFRCSPATSRPPAICQRQSGLT